MGWDIKDSGESYKYSWIFYEDVEIPNWLLTIVEITSGKRFTEDVGGEAYENYEKIINHGIDECVESGFSKMLTQEQIEFAESWSEEENQQ